MYRGVLNTRVASPNLLPGVMHAASCPGQRGGQSGPCVGSAARSLGRVGGRPYPNAFLSSPGWWGVLSVVCAPVGPSACSYTLPVWAGGAAFNHPYLVSRVHLPDLLGLTLGVLGSRWPLG